MAISLSKGQKVDLTKGNPGLSKVIIGLGWDVNKYDGGNDFDLDTSAFLLGENGKVPNDSDFVFYNNPTGGNGSIVHSGDNRTGAGDGDDEQIIVDLKEIPATIQRVAFTITIHDGEARNQNFGQVSNSYVRILNEETNEELIRYDLGEDFSIETALVVGELYRHNNEWKFSAIGSGYQGGLAALATDFGLQVG
ncbi:TerD family protein [Niallia sp.]|uniref:TerD family protein n=1 Tax=Niallia sp. TaxID=2837523 RepID=UPI002899B233|nr:TerD family protein [Niallia sp.]